MSVYASSAQLQQNQNLQHQQQQRHQQRLNELLDAVKQEFDFALNEASNFSKIKEDYDSKCSQQTAEMQQIRQTVYELEMAHRKIKEAYEEEILRLKTELENRDRQIQHKQPTDAQYPYPYPQQQQQQQQQLNRRDVIASSDHMTAFFTKKTPVFKVHFTRRNLCLAAGPFQG